MVPVIRAALLLSALSGRLELALGDWQRIDHLPAQTFEARLLYDGDLVTASISFPAYEDIEDTPDFVTGEVIGDGQIVHATIETGSPHRTFVISAMRKPGDERDLEPLLECELHDEDLGHPTRCTKSLFITSLQLDLQ